MENQRFNVIDCEDLDNESSIILIKDGYDKLTERERKVLKLITRGYSNGEIATNLYISTHTAKAHVSAILDKLHVKNRAITCYLAGKLNFI